MRGFSLCFGVAATAAKLAKPPHVIFNVVDDWGYNDVGYHNTAPAGTDIATPNIDALAAGGVKLEDYNVFRFCSPTRSTFLSGRHPYHVGQQTGMNLNPMPGVACGIHTAYDFLPKVLGDRAGYRSHSLGKWHVGYYNASQTPTHRGFSSYLGYYSGAEEHFSHLKAGCGQNYFDLANSTGRDGAVTPAARGLVGDNGTYSVHLYGNESVRTIRAHDPGTPLYMYLAWNVVHAPCEAPQHYVDRHANIKDLGRRKFAGMLSSLDEAIPQIVAALKERGMWDNTVFIVTTDNGGNLGGSGNNWPLRGGKFTFWQGGVRGNAFIHSPLLPAAMAGATWHGLAHAVDWYTTIADLAGVASLDGTGLLPPDGVQLWDAIVANASSPRTELVLNIDSSKGGLSVLRQGRWKLVDGYPGNGKTGWDGWTPLPSNSSADAAATHWLADADVLASPFLTGAATAAQLAGMPCAGGSPCLFDVFADPQERHDLASANPDVVRAMQARVAELAKSEVTVEESGLCPFSTGTRSDCQCAQKAKESGFWEPWCDAGSNYTCTATKPTSPTPAPPPSPPVVPTPKVCAAAARAAPAAAYDEVRADPRCNDTAAFAAKQVWDVVVVPAGSAAAAAAASGGGQQPVQLKLRASAGQGLCMGVSGATIANPAHGDVRLLPCSSSDAAQLWLRVPTAQPTVAGEFSLQQHNGAQQTILDLQKGTNMEAVGEGQSTPNKNQRFAYDPTDGTLKFTTKPNAGLLVDVC